MNTNFRQFATVFGLSALLGTAALVAQNHQAVAKIPFGFHVRDSVLPAGTYSVAQESSGVLQVRRASDGKVILLMPGGRDTNSRKDAHLTFKRYGSDYFLSEVALPDQTMTQKIPPSSREKEFAKGNQTVALVNVSLDGE